MKGGAIMSTVDNALFEIEELEVVEAPGDGHFWAGVAVGVAVGIVLC